MHERQSGVEASGGGRVRVSIELRAWVSDELSVGVRARASDELRAWVSGRVSIESRAGVRSRSHSHSDFVSGMPV
jgi:hypothetical protein